MLLMVRPQAYPPTGPSYTHGCNRCRKNASPDAATRSCRLRHGLQATASTLSSAEDESSRESTTFAASPTATSAYQHCEKHVAPAGDGRGEASRCSRPSLVVSAQSNSYTVSPFWADLTWYT